MLLGSPSPRARQGLPSIGPPSRFARLARLTTGVGFFLLVAVSFSALLSTLLSLARLAWKSDIQTLLAKWAMDSPTASYPTAFTRDILPRPIHSHNDYWRRVPLFSAISAGAVSVEADVWEFAGTELFVGHDTSSLTRNRTFRSLYVDPLVRILKGQNPHTEFTRRDPEKRLNGVFDVDPGQTLHLFVDFKTPGEATFPVVVAHLQPLRSPVNYLTHFNGTEVVRGPVTVHFTGDAPFDTLVSNTTYRDYFYDAPLSDLASGKYTPENTIIASAPFGREIGRVIWGRDITKEQIEKLRAQIGEAHDRGIKARYWDTPGWPVSVRNRVWGCLVGEGVDLLNADDLKAASTLEW